MNEITQNQGDSLLDCEICLREIPVSEAKSEEAVDYVTYYYGLECYAIWKQQEHHKHE